MFIQKSLKNYKRTNNHQEKLNNRFNSEYIKKFTNSISRNWEVITPDGKKIIVKNMAEYCRQNNLNKGGMSKSSKTGIKHKGYICQKVGT